VGYPEAARGILTSGGSLAVLTALVTARRERLPEDFLSGTLYVSDQTHHSVAKAAVLAGFPPGNVREVETDGRLPHPPRTALAERVAQDRRAGALAVPGGGQRRHGQHRRRSIPSPSSPASPARRASGSTPTPPTAVSSCSPRGAGRTLAGIEQADSVVLDPHKGLFLPYGNGALLVRDGQALRRAHTFGARYLPESQEDPDLVDFHLYGPELSKPLPGPSRLAAAQALRGRELPRGSSTRSSTWRAGSRGSCGGSNT
jgi:aromatic-L-amino-acid/L-tryptophan decarboxylase